MRRHRGARLLDGGQLVAVDDPDAELCRERRERGKQVALRHLDGGGTDSECFDPGHERAACNVFQCVGRRLPEFQPDDGAGSALGGECGFHGLQPGIRRDGGGAGKGIQLDRQPGVFRQRGELRDGFFIRGKNGGSGFRRHRHMAPLDVLGAQRLIGRFACGPECESVRGNRIVLFQNRHDRRTERGEPRQRVKQEARVLGVDRPWQVIRSFAFEKRPSCAHPAAGSEAERLHAPLVLRRQLRLSHEFDLENCDGKEGVHVEFRLITGGQLQYPAQPRGPVMNGDAEYFAQAAHHCAEDRLAGARIIHAEQLRIAHELPELQFPERIRRLVECAPSVVRNFRGGQFCALFRHMRRWRGCLR